MAHITQFVFALKVDRNIQLALAVADQSSADLFHRTSDALDNAQLQQHHKDRSQNQRGNYTYN